MTKYIIGVIALLVIIGGVWYWMQHSSSVAPDMGSTDQGTTMAATSTYATSTFSVVYPSDFTVDPNYQYTEVANKPIPGVSFIIPGSMATGTNLASDSYVSIESLPRAKICTGDIYLPENVKSKAVNDNGVDYSLATSSGVAAGN
ncbi:MAG TPA: hypothetical protein VN495_01120, partial [Candidatus Paceibacterota bacterium]|nr:hypothetical protein [Candidatus Paceibacterota bacterium]